MKSKNKIKLICLLLGVIWLHCNSYFYVSNFIIKNLYSYLSTFLRTLPTSDTNTNVVFHAEYLHKHESLCPCAAHRSHPFLSFSGRWSSREVWRKGAVCCFASSSCPQTVTATWRARPRRELGVGSAWASSAAPTWQPWTSTASPTPTSKRELKPRLKLCYCHWIFILYVTCVKLKARGLNSAALAFYVVLWAPKGHILFSSKSPGSKKIYLYAAKLLQSIPPVFVNLC